MPDIFETSLFRVEGTGLLTQKIYSKKLEFNAAKKNSEKVKSHVIAENLFVKINLAKPLSSKTPPTPMTAPENTESNKASRAYPQAETCSVKD